MGLRVHRSQLSLSEDLQPVSIDELRALLAGLEADCSPRGFEDYAIVFVPATSGLRAWHRRSCAGGSRQRLDITSRGIEYTQSASVREL